MLTGGEEQAGTVPSRQEREKPVYLVHSVGDSMKEEGQKKRQRKPARVPGVSVPSQPAQRQNRAFSLRVWGDPECLAGC